MERQLKIEDRDYLQYLVTSLKLMVLLLEQVLETEGRVQDLKCWQIH